MTKHTDTSRIADLRFQVSEKMPINHSDLSCLFDRIEALEAENERLRGKVSQAILYFDDIAGLTENPLYDPLEVGFRHSPLSPKEREERYTTACSAAWQSAQHGLAALGEKQ